MKEKDQRCLSYNLFKVETDKETNQIYPEHVIIITQDDDEW